MNQEKYVEYFVDVMTKTLQDTVVKSISLQANLRLSENIIKELQSKVEELDANDNKKIQQLQNEINVHINTINTLKGQVNDLSVVKSEYESVKHQVQHIDTFTNELNKTREELQNVQSRYSSEIEAIKKQYESQIQELKDQIDYLKLTPAKRKKIDEVKAAQTELISAELEELVLSDEIIKDGGSF